MEFQEGVMRSSKKFYSKNNENYDIYYNEGNPQNNNNNNSNIHNNHNNIHHTSNNSTGQLRSSKKVQLPNQ